MHMGLQTVFVGLVRATKEGVHYGEFCRSWHILKREYSIPSHEEVAEPS